jgi:hypothetical protein
MEEMLLYPSYIHIVYYTDPIVYEQSPELLRALYEMKQC